MVVAQERVVEPVASAAAPGSTGRFGFQHIPALDGLRGLAVFAVLLFHGGHLTGGYLGVDLFFVLSGFLITSLLLAERSTAGKIALRSFWARRVRRLLPAVLVLMLGIALYALFVSRAVDLQVVRDDALATLAYVANWRNIIHGSNYWDLTLAPSPLSHMWSLAIEEQFYFVWPFAILLLTRRAAEPARRVLLVAGGGALVSFALFVGLYAAGASQTRVYEGTDTRAGAMLLGAALAAWRALPPSSGGARFRRRLDGGTLESIAINAGAFLLLLVFFLDGQSEWLYRGGLPLASVLGVVLVAGASQPSTRMLGPALSWRPLRALGAISYGLYLWHWPIFTALEARNGRLPLLGDRVLEDPILLLVKLALSLAAAILSYHFVEAPIRRGAIRKGFGAASAVWGIGLVAILVILSTQGAIDSTQTNDVRSVSSGSGAPLVVAGDSLAVSFMNQLGADPDRFGINAVNRTAIGCAVITGAAPGVDADGKTSPYKPCRDYVLPGLADLEPAAVFLMNGARPNGPIKVDGQEVYSCQPVYDDAYAAALTTLITPIRESGARVVIATIAHTSVNGFQIEGADERVDCANAVIRRVAESIEGTSVLDLNELLCPDPDAPCIETLDGGPIRPDGLHYDKGPGGAAVADWIVEHVLELAGLERSPDPAGN